MDLYDRVSLTCSEMFETLFVMDIQVLCQKLKLSLFRLRTKMIRYKVTIYPAPYGHSKIIKSIRRVNYAPSF
jgi:hypothetical protein